MSWSRGESPERPRKSLPGLAYQSSEEFRRAEWETQARRLRHARARRARTKGLTLVGAALLVFGLGLPLALGVPLRILAGSFVIAASLVGWAAWTFCALVYHEVPTGPRPIDPRAFWARRGSGSGPSDWYRR